MAGRIIGQTERKRTSLTFPIIDRNPQTFVKNAARSRRSEDYELLLEAGFSPVEAIQIMTLNGAKILGVDDRLGSIAPGKLADFVVVRGNPVVNAAEIRNVTIVFKDGVGYDSPKSIAAVKGLVGIR